VESKISFRAVRNSPCGIEQLVEMCSHLLSILLIAKSSGMLVKRDVTSSEIKIWLSLIKMFFNSQHPISQKKGTIIGMVDRALLLSHPRFQQKNLIFIINVLLNNDYPIKFIFDTINTRLRYMTHYTRNKTANTQINQKWFTIPYLDTISQKLRHITNNLDTKTSFYSLNKLENFIKGQKDSIPKLLQTNLVYKLTCRDCDATYVGQTGRTLKTRISEHRNHINRNTNTHSVITEHRTKFSHEFNWDNVEILDRERFLSKRLISEMIYIKRQKNSLNLQSDTDCLDDDIITILNKLQEISHFNI